MGKTVRKEKLTDRKEFLFNDFFSAAVGTLEALELFYSVNGVVEQVFGDLADEAQAKARFRSSGAWETLSILYDYAVDGIENGHPNDIVIAGSDVVKLATSENSFPSSEWGDIVSMADGRSALDDGSYITLHKLALLANVDIRTVRNAVSAGDLVTTKMDDEIYLENASARRWLCGRRGFKPTLLKGEAGKQSLDDVNTPAEFAAFLLARRQRVSNKPEGVANGKLVVLYPGATAQAMQQLEAGVFALPLDATLPIADFYQLDRKSFLNCVMRVFFLDELRLLACEAPAEKAKA